MQLDSALRSLAEIQNLVSRTEFASGFRARTSLAIGSVALACAIYQTLYLPSSWIAFVAVWLVVALFAAGVTMIEVGWRYRFASSNERSVTRATIMEFLPATLACGLVTLVLVLRQLDSVIPMLPGFWAIFFSLAVFSTRRRLGKLGGLIGCYYLVAGSIWVLCLSSEALGTASMFMGGVFGVGHLLAAYSQLLHITARS